MIESHIRARIRLNNNDEAAELVSILNRDGTIDKYILEDMNCTCRVSARSLLGVIYIASECSDNIFLANLTEDGKFPSGIDKFRPTGSF